MDTVIINAWEHRHVREDDDAYEGRINLGTPKMSPPLASARTNALQMRATVEGGGSGCNDGPGKLKQGPGCRETRATVKEGGRWRMQ